MLNVNWPDVKRIYFIGIGGIGMSALARYCNYRGLKVSGYDKTETILTQELIQEGIAVHYDDDILALDAEADLVVYTPAIPPDHKELNYYKSHNYPIVKRSDLLQEITRHSRTIAIGGTHGKTTTTTLVAHILRHSGVGCTAFLGGISSNYNTNFWSSDQDLIVVEADEYDRSFHKLHPFISVITSCDADHLDIYQSKEALVEAFQQFAVLTHPQGALIYRSALPVQSGAENVSYSVSDKEADITAGQLTLIDGYYHFSIYYKDLLIDQLMIPMPGLHNIENTLAAVGVALKLGIETGKIRRALQSFRGVKRRFEILINQPHLTYVDDYAHHPTEIRAAMQALRSFRPEKKITVVFQPHLFTRTKDFAPDFAEALSLADEIILLPVYPARELPIEGVHSEWLVSLIKNTPAIVVDKKELLHELSRRKLEVLCTMGAGDIDQFTEPIKKLFTSI
jgi:UDP-N-acetylmuramate--alanine ligase